MNTNKVSSVINTELKSSLKVAALAVNLRLSETDLSKFLDPSAKTTTLVKKFHKALYSKAIDQGSMYTMPVQFVLAKEAYKLESLILVYKAANHSIQEGLLVVSNFITAAVNDELSYDYKSCIDKVPLPKVSYVDPLKTSQNWLRSFWADNDRELPYTFDLVYDIKTEGELFSHMNHVNGNPVKDLNELMDLADSEGYTKAYLTKRLISDLAPGNKLKAKRTVNLDHDSVVFQEGTLYEIKAFCPMENFSETVVEVFDDCGTHTKVNIKKVHTVFSQA